MFVGASGSVHHEGVFHQSLTAHISGFNVPTSAATVRQTAADDDRRAATEGGSSSLAGVSKVAVGGCAAPRKRGLAEDLMIEVCVPVTVVVVPDTTATDS